MFASADRAPSSGSGDVTLQSNRRHHGPTAVLVTAGPVVAARRHPNRVTAKRLGIGNMSVIVMAIEHYPRSGAATSRALTMSSVAESAETGPPVQTEAKDDEAFVGVVTRSGCQGRRWMRVSAPAITKADRSRRRRSPSA